MCLDARSTVRDVVVDARPALPMSSRCNDAHWCPLPHPAALPAQRPELSAAEVEALRLHASGASVSEVAARMTVQFENSKDVPAADSA